MYPDQLLLGERQVDTSPPLSDDLQLAMMQPPRPAAAGLLWPALALLLLIGPIALPVAAGASRAAIGGASSSRRLLASPSPPPRPFDPLRSPFGDPSRICPVVDGQAVLVNGFPSSPFVWRPFTLPYSKPKEAVPVSTYIRYDGHSIVSFKVDVYPVAADFGCPRNLTRFLTYGGTVPGERGRPSTTSPTLIGSG